MRFLGIGDSCDLGALYIRLAEEGHEVKVFIAHPLCQGTLAGLIEHVSDWRTELPWVLAAGENGFILFENVGAGRGEVQDALRRDGHNVIGSSTYGARLENDRGFAQRVLAETGLSTAPFWEFSEREAAIRFLEGRPARYVLKFNGPDAATYVGRLQSGNDVKALLTTAEATVLSSFILMEFVDGVEMGVGAYFNGAEFLQPVCLDWEHKRFFPGDLGELTGEMGTVVTYSRSKRFFDLTLGRMEAILRKEGYCGYVNLNTIVNEQGIWPLEFTCRFGYPGYAILDPLQETSWADLFHAMITRSTCAFVARPGFAVGIGVTTPPFPYSRSDIPEPIGLPVLFEGDLTPGERRHVHYGEVGLHGGALVTSGMYGWTMVVTGVGASVASAQTSANLLADRVLVPNARYRRDIGRRLIEGDLARVEALGLLDPLV
jgi:phosphoribosylamine---glycine ligase